MTNFRTLIDIVEDYNSRREPAPWSVVVKDITPGREPHTLEVWHCETEAEAKSKAVARKHEYDDEARRRIMGADRNIISVKVQQTDPENPFLD
jgi:hypothetical protein